MLVPMTDVDRRVLQAVYDFFLRNGRWPAFAAIARPLRRDHGLDAAGIIAAFPRPLMIPPRDGLRPVDGDQIRLSLLGIQESQGSADDGERFCRLIRWFAKRDLEYDPPSSEGRLQITGSEAAAHLGIDEDHPALPRLRAMFGLDRVGVSTGGSDENGWAFYIDSDIWRFQDAQDLADCARIRQEWIDEATAEGARRWSGTINPAQATDTPVPGISSAADLAGNDGPPALAIITRLLRRFPAIVRELEHRHDRRSPMAEIRDEYDVQDLLRGILTGLFDDVRDEEPTPSHGGLASRMDLLLKSEQIVIETKMTRATLSQRKVAEEVATDKELYRSHPSCRTLVCFVYDPGRHLRRPAALEADLTDLAGPVSTIVVVAPLD